MIKRRAIPKEIRQAVYEKCGKRCAYCGCPLEYKDMQVDHAVPLKIGGQDNISNYMPSCRSCNHYKSTLDIEGFREYLSGIHKRLRRDNVTYNIAERFGVVRHVTDDIIFYYEQVRYKD
jgi:5-methylcytosine-specific restriction endonuclease McrA